MSGLPGNSSRGKYIWFIGLFLVGLGVVLALRISNESIPGWLELEPSEEEEEAHEASKAARLEYWFNMLRDPETNAIPKNVRGSELRLAAQIQSLTGSVDKKTGNEAQWVEIGPHDVGGRTRALVIDIDNPSRLLTGGVSGGLWESTDEGTSWHPIKTNTGSLSVTAIAQDPRLGQRHVWYYASGEFDGNSASDLGLTASYNGNGLFKSTDNGKTWSLLPAAHGGNDILFDSPFDFVSNIVVSPITGTVFVASNAFGIFRSDDQGNSFGPSAPGSNLPRPVLGGINEHLWSDVAVSTEGRVLAVLSSEGSGNGSAYEPGVYESTDDGITWNNITPPTFPDSHGRSIIAFAPSAPNTAYIFTTTNDYAGPIEDVRLHRIYTDTGNSEDLTANLPYLSEAGNIETQGGYNMSLAVKPDEANFVLLGATNVYRSRDGFSSPPEPVLDYWIGGYDAVDEDYGHYANHHPDQHIFLFDPVHLDRLWNGNDGGIYMTDDITVENGVVWNDMNAGYNVTQFYTVALSNRPGDPRVAGGSQDNGTPMIRLDDPTGASTNISVGDGGHLYFGESFAYVGFQNGFALRLPYDADNTPTFYGFSFIQPQSAFNQLFITPFVVDPSDENFMYYAAGSAIWRNDQLGALESGQTDGGGSDAGWTRLSGIPSLGGLIVSALAISRTPAQTLYYGASDTRATNAQPRLFRMRDATTGIGDQAVDISIPNAPAGAYIADIAINPYDADELLVVMSNYRIVGLYHSMNGGASFEEVEGNLVGSDAASGPSLRAAAIMPTVNGADYYLGTSIGLFKTKQLDGPRTEWLPESIDEIGQSVVTDIATRAADGIVVVATHGRGLYLRSQGGEKNPEPQLGGLGQVRNFPNPFASVTRIAYELPARSSVSIEIFDLTGRRITNLVNRQEQAAGPHFVEFNAENLPSGTYLYRLLVVPLEGAESGAIVSKTRMMTIVR